MRIRKCGTFNYKGSSGFYAETVEHPSGGTLYAAIDYGMVEDALFPAIDRYEVVDIPELDHASLFARIDQCL